MKPQNARVVHETKLSKASCDMHVEMDKGHRVEQHEIEKTVSGDGCVSKVESRAKTDIGPTALRFEVDY